MSSDAGDPPEWARFDPIHRAFLSGNLAALRAAVDDPSAIPNGQMPLAYGPCLEYAIYHSPVRFIRELLALGANPNPTQDEHIGFPPLIAALSCTNTVAGGRGRPDIPEILELLLAHGADPNQRGTNDFTPLHQAVCMRNPAAIPVLLAAGADPSLRTRIDDYETPRELAFRRGFDEVVRLLDAWPPKRAR